MMAREVVARIRKLLLILCDPLYRGALRYGLGAGTEHQKGSAVVSVVWWSTSAPTPYGP